MKLCATIRSERGKPVQKTANDRLEIDITLDFKLLAVITVLPSGTIMVEKSEEAELKQAEL